MTEIEPGNSDNENIKVLSLSISFIEDEMFMRDNGPYKVVVIRSGYLLGEPGQPALPWKKFYVSLPFDAVLGELTIKDTETALLAEDVTVEPCQPNVPTLLGTKVEWVHPDRELYDSESVWPEVFAKATAIRYTGGFAMAEIEVCPFRYHLRSKKLELIKRLDFSISYKQRGLRSEKSRSVMALRHEKKFAERVMKLVLNPGDVSRCRQLREAELLTDFTNYPQIDYVIITSDYLADRFQRLANWRTIMGLETRVVTVKDIKSGNVQDTGGSIFWHNSGYLDGGPRDEAEAIRNFIKWASVNWLTDYVLLGGDVEIIPCRKALHFKGDAAWISYGDISIPHEKRSLGALASASSEKTDKLAKYVLDNNPSTVWECDPGDPNPWIQLSVKGKNTPANSLDPIWGVKPNSYTFQVSLDGMHWADVATTPSGSCERLNFSTVPANYVRLLISGGSKFSLVSMKLFGPKDIKAYKMSETVTRIYLGPWINPNPSNALDDDLILFMKGPKKGIVIPYDTGSNDTKLGWHFIEELVKLGHDQKGTVSTTSTRFVEICGPSRYHGNDFIIKWRESYIPSDLYFSDIGSSKCPSTGLHDWDWNNNGVYGEWYSPQGDQDGVNGIADLYVGRAPVNTPYEVDVFIDKIINYERFVDKDEYGLEYLLPDKFAVSVLLGSENFGEPKSGVLDGSAEGKEDIRRTFLNFNPDRWIFTRRYEDVFDVPPPDQTSDLKSADKGEILDAIKYGQNVVSLSSHGNSDYICYLGNGDIDGVISYPSIFYGNACSTNMFDFAEPKKAFSELAILNAHGAAVAYVGNSRAGWTGDNPPEREFWEEMLYSDRLGEMFSACKQVADNWARHSLNLLGDPAMRVWSDRPKRINVAHLSEIKGGQHLEVTVTSNSKSVENALVCLTIDGSLFVTGTTNASGEALIYIEPYHEGKMRVSVSGKNLIPYLGSVNVKKGKTGSTCTKPVCGVGLCGKPLCVAIQTCGPYIFCSDELFCPKMFCGHTICSLDIGPDKTDAFKHISEICGFEDINELAKQADTTELAEKIDKLPPEIRKSIRMMIEKIKDAENPK